MKKISILLVLAMLLSMLAACDSENVNKGDAGNNSGLSSPINGDNNDADGDSAVIEPTEEKLNLSMFAPATTSGLWDDIAAVQPDGSVIVYSRDIYKAYTVPGWSDMVSVTLAPYERLVGLRKDGTVLVGNKYEDHMADTVSWPSEYAIKLDWTDIKQICTDGETYFGLRSDGTVVTTELPTDDDGITVTSPSNYPIDQWTDIVKICFCEIVGPMLLIGLKSDGTVVLAGSQSMMRRHSGVASWEGIIDIDAMSGYVIGLKQDGTAVASVPNSSSIDVSGWTDIVAVAAGEGFVVGLKSDGTLVTSGQNDYKQCDTLSWTDVVAISAGPYETFGIQSDGTLLIAGRVSYENLQWEAMIP